MKPISIIMDCCIDSFLFPQSKFLMAPSAPLLILFQVMQGREKGRKADKTNDREVRYVCVCCCLHTLLPEYSAQLKQTVHACVHAWVCFCCVYKSVSFCVCLWHRAIDARWRMTVLNNPRAARPTSPLSLSLHLFLCVPLTFNSCFWRGGLPAELIAWDVDQVFWKCRNLALNNLKSSWLRLCYVEGAIFSAWKETQKLVRSLNTNITGRLSSYKCSSNLWGMLQHLTGAGSHK